MRSRVVLWVGALCACKAPIEPPPVPAIDTDTPSDTQVDTDTTHDTDSTPAPLALVSGPELVGPADPAVLLTKVLLVEVSAPCLAILHIDGPDGGRDIALDGASTHHEIPVLGLHESTTYSVSVTLRDAADPTRSLTTEPLELTTGTLAALRLPELTVRTHDTARAEPGMTVLAVQERLTDSAALLAVDMEGRPVWIKTITGQPAGVSVTDTGRIVLLLERKLTHSDFLGADPVSYAAQRFAGEGDIPVDADRFHHDALLASDGAMYTFTSVAREVSDYPLSYDDPTLRGTVTIQDDVLLEIQPDGTVSRRWSPADLLDPTRIGYDSLKVNYRGRYDWGHANAVVRDVERDRFVMSLRNQDTVVSFDGDTGAVRWILANPDGWTAPLDALRLQPTGPLSWTYHQHAPKPSGDGLLSVFDNGSHNRTTPQSQLPHPGKPWTRVVVFELDEEAGTVSESWSFAGPSDGPLFSEVLGNTQFLPQTGNVLATFPHLLEEGGVSNIDAGFGLVSVRIIEIDAETHTEVWDLSVRGPPDVAARGWRVDRAVRVPSLYIGRGIERPRP